MTRVWTKVRAVALGMTMAAAAPMAVQAQTRLFSATLAPEASGATGTGTVLVTWNTTLNTMRLQVSFSGLSGIVSASHIHCCLATPFTGNAGVATGVPTFAGFPSGVSSGTYDNTFDMTLASSYNPAFVTAQGGVANAGAALLANLATGQTYLNIHTSTFGGGEIRGYLTAVPEPSTYALMAAGLALLVPAARRRRRA